MFEFVVGHIDTSLIIPKHFKLFDKNILVSQLGDHYLIT